MIVTRFPLEESIRKPGAFSLHDWLRDYISNHGAPNELFFRGQWLLGRLLLVDAVAEYSNQTIMTHPIFPAIGNHDLNSPSGCTGGT